MSPHTSGYVFPYPPLLPQATQGILGPSPRAGGRPADLDPAVAATAGAAASGCHFYPLLWSEASSSPHPAASMSPTAVPPRASSSSSSSSSSGGGSWLQGTATSAEANP